MALRPLRIVLAGGSGQVGTLLARYLHDRGHAVTVICRHRLSVPWPVLQWTGYDLGPWTEALNGASVVINLAGHSVNCRYNEANRREIKTSRTITTGLIGQAIGRCSQPPPLWLNASTATIYRHSTDTPMEEGGEIGGSETGIPHSWKFSVEVAKSWEAALFAADTPRTRRVAMRSGMIMTPYDRGVFDTLLRLVRYGLGGAEGPGTQFISWIHDVDFVRAVEFLIGHEELKGAINICSPGAVPNRYFMRCLRHAWCTTYIGLPLPVWLLSAGALVLGTETELILKSRRVVPRRLQQAGFEFHFPNWRAASQDLVHRWRETHDD
jgi:hypothetical protein